ncbi:MAG: ABC transporter substrate-binding protein [Acetobacteraceae bacterium]
MSGTTYHDLCRRIFVARGLQTIALAGSSALFLTPIAARAAGAPTLRPALKEIISPDLEGSLNDQLPEAVRKKSVLVLATDATAGAPYASIDEHSQINGMVVDIANAIGYVLGVDVKVANSPFDDIIPGLQSGRFDLAITDMLDTKKREQVVDFVDYLVSGSSFLVATDSKLHDLDLAKLCGLSVAVERGSVEEAYVTKQTGLCKQAGNPPIKIQVFQGNNEMFLAVVGGRSDVMMGPRAQLSYVEKISHGKVRSAGKPIGAATDGIAVPKGKGLTKPIQAALQKLIDTGDYKKILALYGLGANGVSAATINHASF